MFIFYSMVWVFSRYVIMIKGIGPYVLMLFLGLFGIGCLETTASKQEKSSSSNQTDDGPTSFFAASLNDLPPCTPARNYGLAFLVGGGGFYVCVDHNWQNTNFSDYVGSGGSQGAPGEKGADGNTILSGSGSPANTDGKDGDFYIDTVSMEMFGPKSNGGWGSGRSLIGAPGPQGVQGVPGVAGARGSDGSRGPAGANGLDGKSLLSGSGAPSMTLGKSGDFYLDILNAVLYGPRSDSDWGYSLSLVGQRGPQGIQGPVGPQGPQGDPGPPGTSASGGEKTLAVVDAEGDFVGRPIAFGQNYIYGSKNLFYAVVLPDGAKFLTGRGTPLNMNYGAWPSGYVFPVEIDRGDVMANHPTSTEPISRCIYANTTCSGKCGFPNRATEDFIVHEYDANGNVIYYRTTGNESGISVDALKPGSYRNHSGVCTWLGAGIGGNLHLALYTNVYTLPANVQTIMHGLKLDMR